MISTEISEHAKEAFDDARFGGKQISELEAIQHGIDLATAERDARIAELEEHISKGHYVGADVAYSLLSEKDREIERLKEERDEYMRRCTESDLECAESRPFIEQLKRTLSEVKTERDEACQWIDSEPDWKDKYNANYVALQSQLTESNAELARKTEQSETWLSELQSAYEKLRELDSHCSDVEAEKSSALSQLSSAQAEIERLKVKLDIAFHPSH